MHIVAKIAFCLLSKLYFDKSSDSLGNSLGANQVY